MIELEKKIKINGAKSGFFLGLIITALGIFYFYYVTAMAKSAILIVAGPVFFYLFIPIFVIVFLCIDARKRIGGYWTFRQATTGIFIMFFITYLVYLVGMNLIFYKIIEPNYLHKTEIAAINAKTALLKQRGDNQKAIDKDIADLKKDFGVQPNVTVGSVIQSIVISILFIFVFALIFGSLFKKDPPYTASISE